MIRSNGDATSSAYSQTLNGQEVDNCLIEFLRRINALSGPFLVSRTGDAGCTERKVEVPKYMLIRYHKGCW